MKTTVAKRLGALRRSVAESVTAEFFKRHPDWADRYGDRGRELGIQDALFHLSFLAGALAGGDPEAFGEYAAWTRRVLEARGISAPFLQENLEQIEAALLSALPPEDHEGVRAAFRAGYAACGRPPAGEEGRDERAPGELGDTARVYLQAILRGDRQAASCRSSGSISRTGWESRPRLSSASPRSAS